MRSHNLRASLAGSSGGGAGSFERGFYGGTGTTLDRSSNYFTPGTWSSTTKNEANAWTMDRSSRKAFFGMYYKCSFHQTVITAKELTDASVPSGAKFNKFSTYLWGDVRSTSGDGMNIDNAIHKGVRWIMHHTTDTTGTNNTGGYAPKSGESRTLLYQDQASTQFGPMRTAQEANSNLGSGGDTTIESMQLEGYTKYNGSTSSSSGTGFLLELDAGGGDDSSASPASFFTWNGSDDVVVEISTANAGHYVGSSYLGLGKYRGFKPDIMYWNDSRVDCHYGSATWNGSGSNQGAFTTNKNSFTTDGKMKNTLANTDGSSSTWYDVTDSEWTIYNTDTNFSEYNWVHALKLDYT